jgi:Tol biopolymer transport system component
VSDAPGSPGLNIWIRDLMTGNERPLTNAANASSPSFSYDGRLIAFRSDRNGGGIYLAPANGGETVLLVARGRDPRFSPAGPLLAYWIANDEETGEFGRVFLLDVSRDPGAYPKAEPLFNGFVHARSPIWSDNGRKVVALGTLQSDVPDKEYDAWTIGIDNGHVTGPPVKSGILPLLKSLGFFASNADRNRIRVGAWFEGFIYLTVPNGDQSTLVRSPLPFDGKSRGGVESLLPGTELFSAPVALSSGGLIFAASRLRWGVWSVPARGGSAASKVASPRGEVSALSASANGSVIAWQSTLARSGQRLVALDVATGTETELALGAVSHPIVSPDGRRVAWRVMNGTKQAIDLAGIAEPSNAKRICENCGLPVSWTPDGHRILFQTGDPNTAIGVLDVVERKSSIALSHPSHSLYGPRYLPAHESLSDGWLLFYAATGPGTRQVFVSALHQFRTGPDSRWISITDGIDSDVEPCWSDGGDFVYFVSQRGAARSVWAIRVDAGTKQPVGKPFLVYRPPTASHTLLSTSPIRRATGLIVAGSRLFFVMDELESGVWLLETKRH